MTPLLHQYEIYADQLDGGTLRLTQPNYIGNEDAIIDLHPDQLRAIAGQLAIPVLTGTAAEMARRLQSLYDRLNNVASTEYYRTEIVERCGSGIEFLIELDGVVALAYEFLQDIRIADPDATPCHGNSTQCHDNSAGIPVTESKRGRPTNSQATPPT